MNYTKKILVIIVLFLLVFVFACSKEDTIQIIDENPKIPETTELTGIQTGDLVEMNFVLYGEDDRIIDTNNKEKAQKAGLTTYSTGPYKFIVGQSSKVKGFDKAVIGLEKGDQKNINILASQDKTEIVFQIENIESRIKTIPRKQTFPLNKFDTTFGKKAIIGDVVANRNKFPWPYKILAITNNSVLGEIIINEGNKIELPGTQWQSQATIVSDMAIQFLQMPTDGQVIDTEFGKAKIEVARSQMKKVHEPELGKELFYTLPSDQLISPRYEFKVTDISEDTFTITRINFPEQENLRLEVEILDVISNTEIEKKI